MSTPSKITLWLAFALLAFPGLARAADPEPPPTTNWAPESGKLLATAGVSQIEGAGGGGLVPWALITGYGTKDAVGANAHYTYVHTARFDLHTAGAAVGLYDRVELSIARQWFDTRAVGGRLGLGNNYTFDQTVVGAKVRLIGDAVYDQDSWLPQIAIGAQYKSNNRGPLLSAIGAKSADGVDFYVSGTKLFLAQSLLLNATVRATQGQPVRPARLRRGSQQRLFGRVRGQRRVSHQSQPRRGRRIPHQAGQAALRARGRRLGPVRGLVHRQARLGHAGLRAARTDRPAAEPERRLPLPPGRILIMRTGVIALAAALLLPLSGHAATLFADLGAKPGIDRLVENATSIWTADPRIRATFEDTNLVRFKQKLAEQLCQVSDGGCAYSGQTMHDAHKGLHLDTRQFNALGRGPAEGDGGAGHPVHDAEPPARRARADVP